VTFCYPHHLRDVSPLLLSLCEMSTAPSKVIGFAGLIYCVIGLARIIYLVFGTTTQHHMWDLSAEDAIELASLWPTVVHPPFFAAPSPAPVPPPIESFVERRLTVDRGVS